MAAQGVLFRPEFAAKISGARLLLVEDEPSIRNGLVQAFTALGHQVEAQATGDGGLACGLAGGHDAALLDRLSHLADRVEPVYETIEGWKDRTARARSWAQLPAQAIKYVRRVEELVGCPVALLSTSPEREDTILMKNPFES